MHICECLKLGKHLFVYSYPIFTNDFHAQSSIYKRPIVDNYTIIPVHLVVRPGVTIEGNFPIGANSVVSRDILNLKIVVYSLAKVIRNIRKMGSLKKYTINFLV